MVGWVGGEGAKIINNFIGGSLRGNYEEHYLLLKFQRIVMPSSSKQPTKFK
jgi:hypothetical protein